MHRIHEATTKLLHRLIVINERRLSGPTMRWLITSWASKSWDIRRQEMICCDKRWSIDLCSWRHTIMDML